MMRFKLSFIFISILLLATLTANAQIVNAGADYFVEAESNTFINVFYSSNSNPIALKAKSLDNNTADFEWYRCNYDPVTKKMIATLINTQANVSESEINNTVLGYNLPETGYMVRVVQGANIDTLRAWLFTDTLIVSGVNYDNTCGYLRLTLDIKYEINYHWYNFADLNEPLTRLIQNNFTVNWDASVDIHEGLDHNNKWKTARNSIVTKIDDPAPLKEAVYTAKISNLFGNKGETTTVTIPSIAVYANLEVLRPDDNDVYSVTTNLNGEALYKVKFNSKSVNANEFTWRSYGNQLINFERDKVMWSETTEHITAQKEYRPGEFPISLSVRSSTSGCTHATLNKGTILIVEPSKLDPQSIPNAFTPNDDGRNDYFKFIEGQEPVSLEYIDIKLFNSNGLLVYKFNGNIRSWKGWNGKFMGDRGYCETGVYYYIIQARGWDNVSYSNKSLTGSVHLFR